MKAAPSSSPKTKTARGKAAGSKAKGARSSKLKASNLSWLLDRELPAQDQLPENPVLVLRRS